ncbi:hypothetical protein CL619_00860 [archaeon]|nr:hypothetical protein [archaeon]|tara:strand:+ start:867 stop:1271 length:405 start_codon:yes stop_codon:yes gene_type:complete
MTLRDHLKETTSFALVAAGVIICTASGNVGIDNTVNNIFGDGMILSHTFYSDLANRFGADIERYIDCDVRYEPKQEGPWSCDTFSTVEYNGDSALGKVAAYLPRGSGLSTGAALIVGGLFLAPLVRRKEEDYQF